METWKYLCEGSPYEVSDLGNVRKNGKLKKQTTHSCGYLNTRISKRKNYKMKLVHRLVLPTFKPNPAPDFYDRVDHINQVRSDNRLENLRWSNATLNAWNCEKTKGYYLKPSGRFRAQIGYEGKVIVLGTFDTKEEARARYLEALADARAVYDPYQVY